LTGLRRPAAPPLAALARSLQGELVTRSDPGFAAATQLYDTVYDSIRPLAVAYCESPADVSKAIRFAVASRIPLTARAGGHSYGGYSTRADGLVVDVSRMKAVAVAGKTATIGAGAKLGDVYAALGARGVAIPAGTCPTVGIAGLAQGGGVGVSSRL